MVHQRNQLYREMARWRARSRHFELVAELAAPPTQAELDEEVRAVLGLAPQLIAENHDLAAQVIALAREAADREREILRLRAEVADRP